MTVTVKQASVGIAAVAVVLSILTYIVTREKETAGHHASFTSTTAAVAQAKEQLAAVELKQATTATTVAQHTIEIQVLKSSVATLVDESKETNRALWRLIGAIESEHNNGGEP